MSYIKLDLGKGRSVEGDPDIIFQTALKELKKMANADMFQAAAAMTQELTPLENKCLESQVEILRGQLTQTQRELEETRRELNKYHRRCEQGIS